MIFWGLSPMGAKKSFPLFARVSCRFWEGHRRARYELCKFEMHRVLHILPVLFRIVVGDGVSPVSVAVVLRRAPSVTVACGGRPPDGHTQIRGRHHTAGALLGK